MLLKLFANLRMVWLMLKNVVLLIKIEFILRFVSPCIIVQFK